MVCLSILFNRSEALEAALKEKEKTLHEERAKFMKLKEDFKYNLRLLSERDAELEKYDSVFSGKCEHHNSSSGHRIAKQNTSEECVWPLSKTNTCLCGNCHLLCNLKSIQ